MRYTVYYLFVIFFLIAGCADCGDNVSQSSAGRIQVFPDPIAFSLVEIGSETAEVVTLANVADDDDENVLTIFDMKLEAQEGGSVQGLTLVDSPSFPLKIAPGDDVVFSVSYKPEVGVTPPKAQLRLSTSDDRFVNEDKIVFINVLGNNPRLLVNPVSVRFPRLAPGSRETQTLRIRNVGSAPLKILEEPTYSGGEDFKFSLPSESYPLTLDIYDSAAAETNPDAYEILAEVEYAPIGNGADSGEIRIVSNDPTGESESDDDSVRTTKRIEVKANADAPCIQVDELTRNFGQVPLGTVAADVVTVTNCGIQDLEITSIQLDENSADDEFEMNLQSWDANNDGQLDATVRITPGASESFFVRYTPAQVGSDRGRVTIASNDPVQSQLNLDLVGRGSEGVCPVAKVGGYIRGMNTSPRPNLAAAPLQFVVLDGSASSDEDGRVVDYQWEVISQPPASAVVLEATQDDVNNQDLSKREFRLLLAGEYVFELKVRDNEGFLSCGDPARVIVRAIPNEKILIELTWTNPEDPDETDTVGSDVDLHLTKMGPGLWFKTPYDIYFRNPNSGAAGDANGIWNPESPSLDIDDTNGGGPENIQMNDPAPCEWYAIGVHYFRQLFGTAYVTLRVYINAQLVYEDFESMGRGGQFWDVARIHWDSGQVYDANASIFNVPPQSAAPEVTAGMRSSGLCTNQNLYTIQ